MLSVSRSISVLQFSNFLEFSPQMFRFSTKLSNMMRSFFVLLALLAIVTSTASPTCGRALLHRIQSVCGLCTIDAHHGEFENCKA